MSLSLSFDVLFVFDKKMFGTLFLFFESSKNKKKLSQSLKIGQLIFNVLVQKLTLSLLRYVYRSAFGSGS